MADFTVEQLPVNMEATYRKFLGEYDFSPADPSVFSWYRNLPGTTMFVSTDGGKIIASGMSISMGKTGWIGAICTHEDFRGMGLGKAMTVRAIDRLKMQGAKAVLLRASEEGAIVYRKMGFMDSGSYENFMVGPNDFSPPDRKDFREMHSLSRRHFHLDSLFTGESRESLLSTLPGAVGYELHGENGMQSFAYPSVGNGIVGMATDTETMPDMVSKLLSGRGGKLRTIKGSFLNRYMRELGFENLDGARRMVLGEDPLKNKNGIIGTISSSIG